jgi:hypothetical protein
LDGQEKGHADPVGGARATIAADDDSSNERSFSDDFSDVERPDSPTAEGEGGPNASTAADGGPEFEGPRDILDIRPFVVVKKPWARIASILVVLLVLLSLFFLLRKKKVKREIIAPLSPYERALKEIEAAHAWIGDASSNRFAVEVSDAVRTYVERTCPVRAIESTTEELTRALRTVQTLDDHCRDDIQRFLEGCDFIKFTGSATTLESREGLYSTAKHFVDTVEQRLRPPLPEPNSEVEA